MTAGEMMRSARLAKGLTVNELSVISGVQARTITSYENGERSVLEASFRRVVSLCGRLDIPLSYLVQRCKDAEKWQRGVYDETV